MKGYRQANSWSEIVRIRPELRGQVLKVVADSRINRETFGKRPVVLDESRVPRRLELRTRISKRLSILIGLPVEKRIEGQKDVDRPKTVIS